MKSFGLSLGQKKHFNDVILVSLGLWEIEMSIFTIFDIFRLKTIHQIIAKISGRLKM